ncbi:MAG: outer membrane lipoprotein-sorting protein [Gammaproteobacteria bacterium]|nr:outer membrane lipoprotein-sorting protein [Gammaproteobacteria bacterium]MCW8923058.1 outer membrane lipoprotein-sorting protein [Gammaproteobacteria bacterium]
MNIKTKFASLLLIALQLNTFNAVAETAEEKGLAIAIEADRRDTGFIDSTAKMTMELHNKQGDTSTRHIRIKTLEVEGDGDKSMSIFEQPADVKGTAFLTFSHAIKSDEQWMFLPSIKRVKRINSKNKSGPFMGSEFAFEDIASEEVEKYTYKYLRDENLNGIDCFVIERIPTYKHSGYTRQIGWINKAEYRPEKIIFYDRKNSLLKTLTFSGYKKYLDQFWRADQLSMENHQTEKSTLLKWSDYKFRTGLKDKDFSRNSLKRAK